MRLLGLLVSVGIFGCAHNVPQDRATGADGKLKGATPLAFDNGEARQRGIVTYPGGDRIDWKVIELPEGQRGKLDLSLTWKTPRPGLQVAFDVFDQWNTQVLTTSSSGRRGGRSRSGTINDAVGTYFVRVYAPKRGDAGAYTLSASFEAAEKTTGIDPRSVPIPDPPKLPAVPEPAATCDTFDPRNDACKTSCPFDAPDGWMGCGDRDKKKIAAADAEARKLARAECLKNQPQAFTTRVIHVEVTGDSVAIKLDAGTDKVASLTTGWTARVLVAGTDKPIANGSVALKAVGKQQTRGSTGLTVDQLNNNPQVRLSPPPADCP